MKRLLILLVVLVIVWLLWSGLYTPLMLGLGAGSCVLTLFIAQRIGFFRREVFSLNVIPRLPGYWSWLIVEIVKSSFEVARIILQRRLVISPTVVEFEADPQDAVGQAILGNSITLTPGTVTLDISDGRVKVHFLTEHSAEQLISGGFNKRAGALTRQ